MHYHDLYNTGELLNRVREAYRRLRSCDICPHACGVDRLAGEVGICGAPAVPRIASANIHRGEEPPISQLRNGTDLSLSGLAEKMLGLQARGAHNINFVTPTHYTPQILAALYLAVQKGFTLPLVWNTSGYERVDTLKLLDGVVDIYLPDMKYVSEAESRRLSGAPGYPELNRKAVREMLRQVGHVEVDDDGIGVKGLIIRHLVLPEGSAGSAEALQWIAENLGRETHLALMSQYFPAHAAPQTQGIGRRITNEEYAEAVEALEECGLENGWVQDEPE